MKDVQISACLAIENKIKSTKTDFKKLLENKVHDVREKERKTNNLLLDKIKKLEVCRLKGLLFVLFVHKT